MKFTFKGADIKRMLEHWLGADPNGYVGVTYGRNLTQILLGPLDEDKADLLLAWAKEDIPVLKNLSDSEFFISEEKIDFDKKRYYFQVGNSITVPIELPRGALNADITET